MISRRTLRVMEVSGPGIGAPHREGLVLVIVLWIALGLVAVVLLFAQGMKMEYRAASNTVAGIQAQQALEGARRYLIYALSNVSDPGYFPDPSEYQAEDVPIGNSAFWIIGRADQNTMIPVANDTPTFALVDEGSKLNLNTATLDMLEALPNMTPDLAAAIIDWRSNGSNPQPNGAESDYYSMQVPAYVCKNAPFDTIEELHLVKGMTWDILFGEDANLNGILDPNENDGTASFPDDDANGTLTRALLDYVTVYSLESNKQADGSNRVYVKNGGSTQLENYLNQKLGSGQGTAINERLTRLGVQDFNSLLEFYAAAGITEEQAAQIEDGLTVYQGDTIPGRVNVNTAPREVLVCIPGIGENYADKLIATRQSKSADELATIMWVTEVLDPASAREAGPYITVRTNRLSADIVAVGPRGLAFRRSWMVFDTTGAQPVVVYRQDRTGLGWPLGTALRDQVDSPQGLSQGQQVMGKVTQ